MFKNLLKFSILFFILVYNNVCVNTKNYQILNKIFTEKNINDKIIINKKCIKNICINKMFNDFING